MTPSQIKAAHIDGRPIQCRCKFGDEPWMAITDPIFDFSYLEYRIAPPPPRVITASFHTGFKQDEKVLMIEMTPEVSAAIEAAGIAFSREEKAA